MRPLEFIAGDKFVIGKETFTLKTKNVYKNYNEELILISENDKTIHINTDLGHYPIVKRSSTKE